MEHISSFLGRPLAISAMACLLAAPLAAHADPLATLGSAITSGKPNVDLRLRYENVEQDNALKDASALTARGRVGYTTGKWNAIDAQLEYEGVTVVGDDDYNSSNNGKTTHSVILDPEANDLNQAWIRYSGLPNTTLKLGRQRITWDNHRFIGNVGWRQLEQTYDAYLLTGTWIPKTTFNYAYVSNADSFRFATVDGTLTTNRDLDGSHFINVKAALMPELALTGYGYLLDFETGYGPDSQTIGLRASGEAALSSIKLSYALEYAQQSDYADAPSTVDADYYLAELGGGVGPVTLSIGYEVLGSNDGLSAFQTPLATAHAFQGWADVFVVTPNNGVQDLYVSLMGKLGSTKLGAIYHQFDADEGSMDYGDEIDLLLVQPVGKSLSFTAKYADYSADDFSVDTTKYWLMAEYKF